MKFGLYTFVIENFLNISRFSREYKIENGYGNGYVLIPKGHPFYGMSYDDIDSNDRWEIYIHGGLTYSEYFESKNFLSWVRNREFCGDVTLENYKEFDGFWIIGFDTNHYGDNKTNWSKKNVIKETEDLLEQCLDDSNKDIHKYKFKTLRKSKLLNIDKILNE